MSSLRIHAHLEDLPDVRRFIKEQAEAFGLETKGVYELTLAVDEVVTNILVHGYRDEPGPIEIEVETRGDFLVVHIHDQAEAFDPTRVPEPDLSLPIDQRPVGSLGLFLARKSVDQMVYRVNPKGGNVLTLKKKRTSSDSAPRKDLLLGDDSVRT